MLYTIKLIIFIIRIVLLEHTISLIRTTIKLVVLLLTVLLLGSALNIYISFYFFDLWVVIIIIRHGGPMPTPRRQSTTIARLAGLPISDTGLLLYLVRHRRVLTLVSLGLRLVAGQSIVYGSLWLLLFRRSHVDITSLDNSSLTRVYLRFLNVRCYCLRINLIALTLHTLYGLGLWRVLRLDLVAHTLFLT